ncbi:MAG: hypothetical protein IJ533_07080 [Prevotella sp.]|nr:hypothetical protein [Prevotella sp.]
MTTTFDLLRDGEPIARNLGNRTNFVDALGTGSSQYSVVVKVDGKETERTEAVKPWSDYFRNVKRYARLPQVRRTVQATT